MSTLWFFYLYDRGRKHFDSVVRSSFKEQGCPVAARLTIPNPLFNESSPLFILDSRAGHL